MNLLSKFCRRQKVPQLRFVFEEYQVYKLYSLVNPICLVNDVLFYNSCSYSNFCSKSEHIPSLFAINIAKNNMYFTIFATTTYGKQNSFIIFVLYFKMMLSKLTKLSFNKFGKLFFAGQCVYAE